MCPGVGQAPNKDPEQSSEGGKNEVSTKYKFNHKYNHKLRTPSGI